MVKQDKKAIFLYYWRAVAPGEAEPVPEYRFSTRRWRFDYAWLDQKVAIEIEGGVFVRGAHTRGAHYTSDLEKYNAATALDWRVFRFTPDMLQDNPDQCIGMVRDALYGRCE
jgi:very-short-patch-repair endonuclease